MPRHQQGKSGDSKARRKGTQGKRPKLHNQGKSPVSDSSLAAKGKKLQSSRSKKDEAKLIQKLQEATGTIDLDLNAWLYLQVVSATYTGFGITHDAALAMLRGIAPRDELEGMLAAQMVAVHNVAMECASHAMTKGNSRETVKYRINCMNKLTRTFTQQLEALQRYRGKGQQTVTVQHVNVSPGGQAVVGNIRGGG